MSALDVLEAPEAAAAPGTYPVPPGRGRWRLTLHRRQFAAANWQTTLIGEFQLARARKLVQTWLKPAVLTFDLDGQAPAASLFTELQHDVIAWRWDDTAGADRPVFRGVINASQDQLDESSHVVSVTCTDYLMLLTRRILWTAATYTNMDQDTLAATMLGWATGAQSSGGQVFGAGAYLPLSIYAANPDGTSRAAPSGNLVTRSYYGQQVVFDAFDALAKCLGGFEYDVLPLGGVGMGVAAMSDQLRIFYAGPTGPQQGVVRTSPALVYGSSVSKVTRQITSADYGNYWRELGNSQSNDPSVQTAIGEASNPDASGTVVGLWASPDNQASTILAPTLVAAAAGNLNRYGVLIPVYVLTLRPGFYYAGAFNMGDTLPLVVMHGRLKVNTTVRILGITYNIGDDGQEDVDVVVGRPDTTLYDVIGGVAADVDALARR